MLHWWISNTTVFVWFEYIYADMRHITGLSYCDYEGKRFRYTKNHPRLIFISHVPFLKVFLEAMLKHEKAKWHNSKCHNLIGWKLHQQDSDRLMKKCFLHFCNSKAIKYADGEQTRLNLEKKVSLRHTNPARPNPLKSKGEKKILEPVKKIQNMMPRKNKNLAWPG